MATIQSRIAHNSGIPLGGLGTGSVEIRPDGYFHEWQIFNLGAWAPSQPDCCKAQEPDMPPGALSFLVRAKEQGGAPICRRLGMRTDQNNLYSFSWLKSVDEIEFDATFPVTRLRYRSQELPVSVEATMFSPLTPHDSRTSGTPGFHAAFRVRNLSDKPVELSLAGALKNPLATGANDRRLVNSIARQGDATCLTMRTEAEAKCAATLGSMSLSVAGGEAGWVLGEFPDFFRGFIVSPLEGVQNLSDYGLAHESFWHAFRASGRLPSLSGGKTPERLLRLTDEEIERLTPAQRLRLVREVRRYSFGHELWERVSDVEPASLRGAAGLSKFLRQVRNRLDMVIGKDRKKQTWGDCALATSVTLAPQEEREIRFTLSWFFPNHLSVKGPVIGHMYENWFKDAEDANRFLTSNYTAHRNAAESFAATLFDTTLPAELPDAWAGQLTTLVKCTWWTKDNAFGVWEGLGCCGFHTTDITYLGSFNILALFPDLQLAQMEMGARFQRADGRVHHFFAPDFSAVDEGFDRVDMNQQFVLLICRDYMWTGDRQYLRRMWPHILRAMNNTEALDGNGDGLPDKDTRRNTYDGWDFAGTPAFVANLWLAALRAGIRLAKDLGERKAEKHWRKLLEKSAVSFDKLLWNGDYYSLWVNGKERDECCMTDQLDGEWFTRLAGLGCSLPEERIMRTLRSIMRYNFNPEDGLCNATYPPRRKPRLSTHNNFQAMAPWTGIEYAAASMLFECGMAAEGTAVVRNIHERHMRAGRLWDHNECGYHYYRAMSSWSVLLAATGFKLDLPNRTLTLAPAVRHECFRAPWVSASGWGSFSQTEKSVELECTSGSISFQRLRLKLAADKPTLSLNGRSMPAKVSRADGFLIVDLHRPVSLSSGSRLSVKVSS